MVFEHGGCRPLAGLNSVGIGMARCAKRLVHHFVIHNGVAELLPVRQVVKRERDIANKIVMTGGYLGIPDGNTEPAPLSAPIGLSVLPKLWLIKNHEVVFFNVIILHLVHPEVQTQRLDSAPIPLHTACTLVGSWFCGW